MMWYLEYNSGEGWKRVLYSRNRELIEYIATTVNPRKYRMRGERI